MRTKLEKQWKTKAGYPAAIWLHDCKWKEPHPFAIPRRYRCGYVGIPLDHPLAKKTYLELQDHVEVHGGVTYSRDYVLEGKSDNQPRWWIGFYCLQPGDTTEEWTLERVTKECERLAKQLKAKEGKTQ